jgi:Putative auto-transporter adhesin, head GIN domain
MYCPCYSFYSVLGVFSSQIWVTVINKKHHYPTQQFVNMKAIIKKMSVTVAVALLTVSTFSMTSFADEGKVKKVKAAKVPADMVQKEMPTATFETVRVSGNFKVILTQGDEQKVIVQIDPELVDEVKSFVVGQELNVFTTDKVSNKRVTLLITLKDARNISTFGNVKLLKY